MIKIYTYHIIRKGCVVFFLLLQLSVSAQDPHFSQFYETPLMRNPALAGIFTGDIRLQAVHRDQWRTADAPFTSSVISAEYKTSIGNYEDYVTMGINAFHDQAGVGMFKTNQIMPSLTYHKSLSENTNRYLSIGFAAGVQEQKIDPSALSFDNQFINGIYTSGAASGENFQTVQTRKVDLATGISYNASLGDRGNYFIGFGAWHFLKQRSNFLYDSIGTTTKWQWNAGIKTLIANNIILHAESNVYKQGANYEVLMGGLISYALIDELDDPVKNPYFSLGAGAFLRWNDAIIPVIKIGLGKWSLAMSYDINYSKLVGASNSSAGYELVVSFIDFLPNKNSSLRQTHCPKF